MSGIITLVIALILLVAAVYNLISYIRDRRSDSLPSKKTTRRMAASDAFPDGHSVFIPRCGGHKKAPANRQRPVYGREPRRCRLTRRARRAQGDWRTPSGAYLRHSHWLSS